ncbi:MAG: hypothetical protein R3C26_18900 [Calditrichia bacterium]
MKPPVKLSQPFLYLLIFFTFTSLYFWGCTERERSNPFEPGETDEVISLTLLPESDKITLRWQLNRQVEDITGFRVYRSIGNPDSLAGFQDYPKPQRNSQIFKCSPVSAIITGFPCSAQMWNPHPQMWKAHSSETASGGCSPPTTEM